jgi:hypothetical protein
MTIPVRPVRYESDSQELIDTLQANLPQLPHARLFPWLYLSNPEGRARVWVATDSSTGRMIGVAAAFPRRVYCRGKEVRGYVLGDFCIDARHRSLGLALSLQRACLEGLSDADGGFAFDFPSNTMLAIYRRLRVEVNGAMIRYAKPLRVDRKVAEHIPVGAIARGLSAVANASLRLREDSSRLGRDWAIAAEPGPWNAEFTKAAAEWGPRAGICVVRDAAYLNWRYREHPEQRYEMLTARQGSRLGGYLIQNTNGENATIHDLFAEDDTVCSALLAEATGAARKRGIHTLSVPWFAAHPRTQLLEASGFSARESSPVIVMALSPANDTGRAGETWYLTSGDWES